MYLNVIQNMKSSKNSNKLIKFNEPFIIGDEMFHLKNCINDKNLIGPNNYIKKCETLLEKQLLCKKVLLTNSGTDALEMACILANFGLNDEIIMPSFNFPSSATAVLRCGAKPVFVEIDKETMNISPDAIEKSITKNTRGIIIVHYAGIACDLKKILKLVKKYSLILIEDAAHAIYSKYGDQYLGTFGDFGILSFHQTKNIFCGEGGALLVNKKKYIERSYIIRDKGTNRRAFINGKVSKYKWVDIGSSFIPSSLQAAFLLSQLKNGKEITKKRIKVFKKYNSFFMKLKNNKISLPSLNKNNAINGHFYWILIDKNKRDFFIENALSNNLELTSHYETLHNSIAGKKFSITYSNLDKSSFFSKQLIRIPIHTGMNEKKINFVISTLTKLLKTI